MHKQSYDLAIQLYKMFLQIQDPLTKCFTPSGLRTDVDLTPYFNKFVQFSYSINKKHYTFIFFPFKVYTPPIYNVKDSFISYDAHEVYAFEKSDNVSFEMYHFDHSRIDSQTLSFHYFQLKDNDFVLHFNHFYRNVSQDSLKYLLTLLESLDEESITDLYSSFKFISFLKEMVRSAIQMASAVL